MRRSLAILLSLLAIIRTPAAAQTCMGLASFSAAPVQVTANGNFSDLTTTFGATGGYGIPAGVYGNVGISTTSYDGVEGSALALAARTGYQLNLSTARQIQVCPTASFELGMGPNDEIGGVEQSGRTATVGLALGAEMVAGPRMRVVPSAGLYLGHSKQKAENTEGATLFEISNTFGLAQVGVGIILNQNISLRPSIDIPLGYEGNDATFGLTLGYNFGPGKTRRPH
ncbi:MAG TPA: hypothetical protein VHH32_05130 [Gemmatimonadales bacterium]|nr:hypothetical protein [Gemmatimonadales bacterium]